MRVCVPNPKMLSSREELWRFFCIIDTTLVPRYYCRANRGPGPYAAVKPIPVLAKVGIKHEVGGRRMLGGLLVADPEDNTLQMNALLWLLS